MTSESDHLQAELDAAKAKVQAVEVRAEAVKAALSAAHKRKRQSNTSASITQAGSIAKTAVTLPASAGGKRQKGDGGARSGGSSGRGAENQHRLPKFK